MNEINNEIQPDLLIDKEPELNKLGYKEYIIIAVIILVIIILTYFLFSYNKPSVEQATKKENTEPTENKDNTEIKQDAKKLINEFNTTESESETKPVEENKQIEN